MGPIEAGNDIPQILMILCVYVGLVMGTTFWAKISAIEVPLPWQRVLCKNGHFGQKFHWQGTEFKKCLDLCAPLDLSNQVKLAIYDRYMTLACYNKTLTLVISVTSFLYFLLNFSKIFIFRHFQKL